MVELLRPERNIKTDPGVYYGLGKFLNSRSFISTRQTNMH